MRARTHIWVIEERDWLVAHVRGECPDFSVTAVRREKIALAPQAPHLAVIDATERPSASLSIRELRALQPAVPVLLVSPVSNVEALPEDIDDFLILPFQPGELRMRVARLSTVMERRFEPIPRHERRIFEREQDKRDVGDQDDATIREIRAKYRLDMVIGDSAVLRDAIRKVPRLGPSEANLLITGETGTGKELFARAIHYASARRAHPFVPVNCGALPDTLFENELFGHAKGAYTDASSIGVGLLAVADGGSLFLDEVDSLSLASQAKLLRVLQEREYRPLGSQRAIRANVRVIAAANTPLPERVSAREFRADLYYRLNVLTIRLPSLMERRDDIPLLARHFLTRFARECGRPVPRLSIEAVRCLMQYNWPGNVRELESAVQRAFVLSDGPVLDAASFDLPGDSVGASPPYAASSVSIEDAVYEFQREYLVGLLSCQEGNVTRAARAAGKDRRTFQRLLRRHGIAAQTALSE